jgi:hypothetical protein
MNGIDYAQVIETGVWEAYRPEGGKYDLMREVRRKTVREVRDEIVAAFRRELEAAGEDARWPECYGQSEGLGVYPLIGGSGLWPDGRICVFSVNGSSEGDYVRVEVHGDGEPQLLMLAKVLVGRDESWALARKIADLLGA